MLPILLIGILGLTLCLVSAFCWKLWCENQKLRKEGVPPTVLLNAGRFVSAGSAISAAVHAVRQPLSVIRGYIEMLHSQYYENEKAREYLQACLESTDNAAEIVAKLKGISRPIPVHYTKEMKLSELFQRVFDFSKEQLTIHKIQVTEKFPLQEEPLPLCPEEIMLLFQNLLDNAREALLTVSHERLINASVTETPETITFALTDNGPGMTDEVRARCFDLFYTTRPTGNGLGLPVAAAAALSSGGRIRIAPNSETGCRILVEFPRNGGHHEL